jgi:CubicO group peptidase (beta-lactamase class C family)
MNIAGHCDPAFAAVREAFERNFAEHGEIGASLCITRDGATVVDLWGGLADAGSGRPWAQDTIAVVMSCTKGAVALCGHLLIDRGLLDPEAPVTRYWPAFGQSGKSATLVRHLFSHQSGVIHVKGAVPPDGFCDWDTVIRLIECSSGFHAPGAATGYHVLTHGYLIGELVRRISGQRIGRFFREQIAEPLGLDFWIGLPKSEHARVSRLIPAPLPDSLSPLLKMAMRLPPALLRGLTRLCAPRDAAARAMTNLGGFLEHFDTPRYYAAEIPSAGAITNARGLAGMYAPLANGGSANGVRLVDAGSIAAMRYPAAMTDRDRFLGGRSAFTLGFSKSWSNGEGALNNVVFGEDAFGTPGFGGSIGFADPHHRLSFGYVMNRQGEGTGLNVRGQGLIDALYRVLGSTSKAPGFWVRPAPRPGTPAATHQHEETT